MCRPARQRIVAAGGRRWEQIMTTTTMLGTAAGTGRIALRRVLALLAIIAIAVVAFTVGRVTEPDGHAARTPAATTTPHATVQIERCHLGRPC
jgi:hypothetical protein